MLAKTETREHAQMCGQPKDAVAGRLLQIGSFGDLTGFPDAFTEDSQEGWTSHWTQQRRFNSASMRRGIEIPSSASQFLFLHSLDP